MKTASQVWAAYFFSCIPTCMGARILSALTSISFVMVQFPTKNRTIKSRCILLSETRSKLPVPAYFYQDAGTE